MRTDNLLEGLREVLWGWHVLALILAAGVLFTWNSGFFQVRRVGMWLKIALGMDAAPRKQGGVTRFQAISTALAGSIGTGNIVGVAAAITAGGPGAIFWMWVSALLGMMTVFAENYLAAGRQGGPLSYIQSAGKWGKWLALVYAAGCCLSSLGMGNMVQMNALASACRDLGLPGKAVAAAMGLTVFFVARGGLRLAVKITEKLVPFMTILFFAASLGVLWVHRDRLPQALASIFQGAFSLRAGMGGAVGMLAAMKAGVSRGVFTNEAGLGSSAFAYQGIQGETPTRLGCMGIFQVFADTIVMCTVTGLCILCGFAPGLEGAELTFYAYQSALGDWGRWAVSACTALFALATVVAWCCYGKEGLAYLGGGRWKWAYPAAAGLAAGVGCLTPLRAAFQLGDALNGLMALPNIFALLYLSRKVLAEDGPPLLRGDSHN